VKVATPIPFRPTRHGASAADKLELLEFFLGSDALVPCAQRGLLWLSVHAGARRSLCLLRDVDPNRLITVASEGVSSVLAGEFTVELEDRRHPLVHALAGTEPVFFARGPKMPSTPIDAPFVAFPLRAPRSEELGFGLLLAASPGAPLDADTRWLFEVLDEKLSRVRSEDLVARGRFGRERSLLYDIINTVTDPILLTNPEGQLLIANTRAEKLFTAPDDASEGRRRAVGLNNMLFSAALSSSAIAHAGERGRHELLLVDPLDGSDLLFEVISTPAEGDLRETAIVSVLRNVTDLGRASAEIDESYRKLRASEAEVRAERHRIELIIDSVADPIVVTDADGDIVLMNDPAERLFTAGLSREDASEAVLRRVRANDAHFSSFISNLLFSGSEQRYRGEVGLVDPPTGTPLPVEAIAGKILSEQGELTWVVSILHDQREALEKGRLYEALKQASEELQRKVHEATAELVKRNELLQRQAVELEQASALKSQFLANVSHEVRTPLNAILGYTNMMIQGVQGPVSEAQRKNLTRIDANSRHLLSVINEILDITRIEAGRMPLSLSSFALPQLINEVLNELEPIIARSKLSVTNETARRISQLHTDRQKVKQIVLNLLSNALKFTHHGWVKISARADARKNVIISVADSGIGIDPKDHEKVFEDFRQIDNSPTRPYGGTGLGLSICRRLSHMLEGSIALDSALGEGSTFTLKIPARLRRRK
jgi:PAS domain S-box-containing protein